jgi:hypothetical protein
MTALDCGGTTACTTLRACLPSNRQCPAQKVHWCLSTLHHKAATSSRDSNNITDAKALLVLRCIRYLPWYERSATPSAILSPLPVPIYFNRNLVCTIFASSPSWLLGLSSCRYIIINNPVKSLNDQCANRCYTAYSICYDPETRLTGKFASKHTLWQLLNGME